MTTSSRRFSERDYPEQELTGLIISSGYHVHRTFGFGFLESVYRRALAVELRHRGAVVEEERRFKLFHRDVEVGLYKADLIVEGRVIVETKSGLLPDPHAPAQLLNYLGVSDVEIGLILDFCPELHIKRLVRTEQTQRKHPQ